MKNSASWKYTLASVTGTSHLVGNIPCQDASDCAVISSADGSQVLVAVVSDGAGSAVKADVGSYLTCSSFIEKSKKFFVDGQNLLNLTEDFVLDWLRAVRKNIFADAERTSIDPSDYACTFVAAVVGADEAAFLHLGDGAIVASRRNDLDNFHCISLPQQGEYVNTTHFITDDDALEKVALYYEAGIDEVAIFSDGIQHLVLEYETQMAHVPFFNSVFSWLRSTQETGPDSLSNSLVTFLNSSKVNERTDDDKTLILATRRLSPFMS